MSARGALRPRILPRLVDGWTSLYLERTRIEREDGGVVAVSDTERTSIPIAQLTALLLGPGAVITHDAVVAAAQSGCAIIWVGGGGVRYYALGSGETRSSENLLRQATAWADPNTRMRVARRLYAIRFGDAPDALPSLDALRGLEGVRVREAYKREARLAGVTWAGRRYGEEWQASDAPNRALSAANAALYGVVAGAITALGFSPGIGFLHTGHAMAFVHDVADLYKIKLSIPIAFAEASSADPDLERRVRYACRRAFQRERLIEAVVEDTLSLFDGIERPPEPGPTLYDAAGERIPGGTSYRP
jgi:CRISPR-associated protein Cas1